MRKDKASPAPGGSGDDERKDRHAVPSLKATLLQQEMESVDEGSDYNWWGILISILVIGFMSSLILLAVYLVAPKGGFYTPSVHVGRKLTLKDVLTPELAPKPFNGSWLTDSELLMQNSEGDVCLNDVETFECHLLVPRRVLRQFNAVEYRLSSDRTHLLLSIDIRMVTRHTREVQYLVYNMRNDQYFRLLPSRNSSGHPHLQFADWVPGTSSIVMVHQQNLYYLQDATQWQEFVPITRNADSLGVYNGIPDLAYEEDLFQQDHTIWMTEDGKRLVYLSIDDRELPLIQIPKLGSMEVPTEESIKKIRYPKAGAEGRPEVTLWVVELFNLTSLPVEPPIDIHSRQAWVTGITWSGSSRLYVAWSNRSFTQSYLTSCDHPLWLCQTVWRETGERMIIRGGPVLSRNEENALIVTSHPADGLRRLKMVKLGDLGKAKLLSADEHVEQILSWDETNGLVYYEARLGSIRRHLMRVNVDTLKIECLTCNIRRDPGEGNATVESTCESTRSYLNPSSTRVVVECRGPSIPFVRLYDVPWPGELEEVRTLEDHGVLKNLTEGMVWPEREFLSVRLHSNNFARVSLFFPPIHPLNRDEDRRFSLVIRIGNLPGLKNHLPTDWGITWGRYLVSDWEIVYGVLHLDPVAMVPSADDPFRTLDYLHAIRWVLERHPEVNRSQVGVWGWGIPGYTALSTLTPTSFPSSDVKCAFAVAPPSDWKHFNALTVERYLGHLEGRDGVEPPYHNWSLGSKASTFRGRAPFLLIHGSGDTEVPFTHTMTFSQQLVNNGVHFQELIYPDEDHLLKRVRTHLWSSLEAFLEDSCEFTHASELRSQVKKKKKKKAWDKFAEFERGRI